MLIFFVFLRAQRQHDYFPVRVQADLGLFYSFARLRSGTLCPCHMQKGVEYV